MITFLHKFVRTYSQYYLFWRRFLAVWCQNCFHLTFCSSIEHYSFWNPASTASCETAGFAYFFVHSFLDWNDPTLNIFLYFYHHGCSGQHRKVPSIIIGSTEALPILCVRYARWERERDTERERERERKREIDGSDVIIVALKLAMSLHFPMPKIRTIAVSSHFPLPKNRTFRFSLHTSCLSIVALKFAVHTFRCQKIRPLCSDSLLNGASSAASDRKPKTNDQILPSPIVLSYRKNESN